MTAAVVLAAGHGTRMHSRKAKVLHELGGLPLVGHVLNTVSRLPVESVVVVVGWQAEAVAEVVGERARLVTQPRPLGTADAVHRALSVLPPDVDRVLVVYGDTPLVPDELLRDLLLEAPDHDAVLVTADMADPTGYGRIIRDEAGRVARVVEQVEATPEELQIHEINTGFGVWDRSALLEVLPMLKPHKEELYLTDCVALLAERGAQVAALRASEPARVMGINTMEHLAEAEAILRRDTLGRLMALGVRVVDPATTYVDATVTVGADAVIMPMTTLRGRTVVGEGAHIGPLATIIDSTVGDHSSVGSSVVEQSRIGPHCDVGPWCHLRPGTFLERDVHIGNFVELKNARLGLGTKAGHHTYLGDATIGAHVNIGAGTVIVNYDGREKHQTFIGDDAFIGCNANLVAPLEIGPGAYVAAGSTVDHNVPGDALAIARARQENKAEWARKRRETAPRP